MRDIDDHNADEDLNGASYEVGYRRPPLHARFKPGVSGNPSGRAKGSQNFKTLFQKIMKEEVSLREGSVTKKISKAEAILRGLVIGAMKGDSRSQMTLFKLAEQTGQFDQDREPLTAYHPDHREPVWRDWRRACVAKIPSEQPHQQGLAGRAGAADKPANGWPADKVERWPIDRLIPYARNARTHSPAQVDQIAASIQEWGWTIPVLVAEDNTLIAGHGRVLAARKLRIAEVPVMVAIGWTEAQKRAYAIADNKLTLNGGWDEELLGLELGELEVLGFDLDLIGFSDAERLALGTQGNVGLTDPDEVPEVPEEAVSITGRCLVAGTAPAAVRRQHIKQSTLWQIAARDDAGHGHGTQKPVECMKRPIENNSSPGQAVYEPFCGSGTTIIAAEITGRSCHAIELMPQYVDVAVERWQAFTGDVARLDGGSTFADVAAERRHQPQDK